MLVPFILLLVLFVIVIAFIIFAARKKNAGERMGEPGKKL
jgi:hypothetical protein